MSRQTAKARREIDRLERQSVKLAEDRVGAQRELDAAARRSDEADMVAARVRLGEVDARDAERLRQQALDAQAKVERSMLDIAHAENLVQQRLEQAHADLHTAEVDELRAEHERRCKDRNEVAA